ncbi:MAG TPA: hypothetical protein VJ732_01985 [Bryobacteraceae bacterium]|nr:hypothetical protein [Bryobacteraceae bacterium]
MESPNGSRNNAIWMGVAIGTAVGIGIALSRRKAARDPWSAAHDITKRVANRSGEISDVTRDILDHIKNIYDESIKVVEEAGELWTQGRKLVGV